MSQGKHGPNRLGAFQAVHQSIMDRFLREGDFVLSEDLSFTDGGDGYIILEGVIECVNGIYIEVQKRIRIRSGDGANAIVQTEAYKYNVWIAKIGNLLRYDSPHPDHNQEHHVHRYDVLAGDTEGTVTFIYAEDKRPTLGEVIQEVRDWYFENLDEVIRRTVEG